MTDKQIYQIQQATYTKDNGDVSDRSLIIMSQPSKNITAIDVSKLPEYERLVLSTFMRRQKEELKAKMEELGAEWKYFKPEGLKISA